MLIFHNENINDLENFLYNSCIHDTKIESIKYEHKEDFVEIVAFNTIFNIKLCLIFRNLSFLFITKGEAFGSREIILSLTVEDPSFLQNCGLKLNKNIENSLYLLFQMFSGDELHIAAKEMIVKLEE